MNKHCMIDLETMGLSPGCAILSIGAVGFYDAQVDRALTFKMNIDLQSCLDVGLTVDPSTEKWWSEQSEEARVGFKSPEPVPVGRALRAFSDWYSENKFNRIWSHGASTDVPWLSAAYEAVYRGVDRGPWHYRDVRDTRTLYDLVPENMMVYGSPEVAHDALSDAIAQAESVCHALYTLRFLYIDTEKST